MQHTHTKTSIAADSLHFLFKNYNVHKVGRKPVFSHPRLWQYFQLLVGSVVTNGCHIFTGYLGLRTSAPVFVYGVASTRNYLSRERR